MDILYYSNHCPNSQKVIQYIAKFGLIDKINAICIDKRSVDNVSGQVFVQLENGKKIMLPPNVHSVPALLVVKNNYSAIFGQDIIRYFEPIAREKLEQAHQDNGEPIGMSLACSSAGVAIMSEQYTLYDLSPDDLSAKSRSEKRPMYNYVSASHQPYKIPTPPDTYRPDKIGESVSIETLTQKRNNDINTGGPATPFGF
jgi:glutaredoxin-related protein